MNKQADMFFSLVRLGLTAAEAEQRVKEEFAPASRVEKKAWPTHQNMTTDDGWKHRQTATRADMMLTALRRAEDEDRAGVGGSPDSRCAYLDDWKEQYIKVCDEAGVPASLNTFAQYRSMYTGKLWQGDTDGTDARYPSGRIISYWWSL